MPSYQISRPLALALFAGVLVFFCFTYYHNEVFYGPRGIHDWAQADRLALAIGYYDDGMNFFRPTTLSEWSRERGTGVEAPLQAYLAAAIAKGTGRGSLALVFRLITLCICCAGALTLFSAAYRVTKDFWLSAFTPLALLCSPVVIAYSGSFLPDAPALWLFLAGAACLIRYFQTDCSRTLAWAMAWFSVAALVKTTLALYYLPIAVWLGLDRLRRQRRVFVRTSWAPLTVTVAGFAAIGGWYLHAQMLNKEYESFLFMAAAQPFKDWEEASNYFNHVLKKQWLRDYFAWPQYGALPAILAAGLPFVGAQRTFEQRLNLLIVMCGIGFVAAFCALGRQLYVHDYYIVSMAFPLVGVALLVASLRLHGIAATASGAPIRRVLRAGVGVALLFSFFFADFQYHQRTSNDYPPFTADGRWPGGWLEGGATLLKELNVPDTTRIIAVGEDPPNRALVHFDRKGIHMSEGVYGKGFEAVYRLARERGISIAVWQRGRYDEAMHAPDSAFSKYFELLTPYGEKVVLRIKDSMR